MIASFLHNFIFIKTKKTAGTTVEMVLAPACGPDDIITPLGVLDEMARGKGEPLCRNFADPGIEDAARYAITSGSRRQMKSLKSLIHRTEFYNHMPASEIRDKLPKRFWLKAYKFTVERHPYEKAVSQAYFGYKDSEPFGTYLDRFVRRGKYSSFEMYSIDGEVVVQDFLRQERLADDLQAMAWKLGIPIANEIPRAKSGSRADRRPAREILSDGQKEIVYGFCKKEFELLGYEP
ncbi:MAG: hypothetical protein JO056_11170 [Alphaproteobacteria bacterium]|nr:hypothetical protein [Alphaproteobacteria bacterium]